MFVFRKEDLPADPGFPAELDKLGYFITSEDKIRKISDPEQEFQFKINRNPRWNDLQREAMNECIRKIVLSRLRNLGLVTLRLPLISGPSKPHVPIMVSRNLTTASRIILVFGEPVQDLGIWAYRTVGTEGINTGSAVDFARTILNPDESSTTTNGTNGNSTNPLPSQKGGVALVLANTGQLVFHCESGRAMTLTSWSSLPRVSAVDPSPVMTDRNRIPGNGNWQEHVNSVFDGIFAARGQLVGHGAKIDVIGSAEGGLGAIRYLAKNWTSWRQYISAICLTNPLHKRDIDLFKLDDEEQSPGSFAAFMASRCRAYLLSHHPLGFPLNDEKVHGCNCYSSGEELNGECVMPKAWPSMLQWLNLAYDHPEYCEKQLVVMHVGAGAPNGVDGD
ncbi:Arb2 domain-containing protein [Aspergillus cavernicola]|uniref:Arb2 domain-containing protein n=1 Tax=Aspergillus cavernicola TaxID=176166 RepID=A0ABR4I325_9EURO